MANSALIIMFMQFTITSFNFFPHEPSLWIERTDKHTWFPFPVDTKTSWLKSLFLYVLPILIHFSIQSYSIQTSQILLHYPYQSLNHWRWVQWCPWWVCVDPLEALLTGLKWIPHQGSLAGYAHSVPAVKQTKCRLTKVILCVITYFTRNYFALDYSSFVQIILMQFAGLLFINTTVHTWILKDSILLYVFDRRSISLSCLFWHLLIGTPSHFIPYRWPHQLRVLHLTTSTT